MIDATEVLAFFKRRRTNYQATFQSAHGRQVLADIEDFCCGSKTTAADNNLHAMAIREGRRQVWLRMVRALNLSAEEQFTIAQQRDKV